jgi:hypothetical protein
MKILCDVCEGAAARMFCAADEAALCLRCDEKVVEIPFTFFHHFPGQEEEEAGTNDPGRERIRTSICIRKYVFNVVRWLSGFLLLFSLFCRCSYSMTVSHAHYVQAGMC